MMRTTEKDLKDKQEIIHRDLLRWLRNYDESQNLSEIRNQSGGVLQSVSLLLSQKSECLTITSYEKHRMRKIIRVFPSSLKNGIMKSTANH